MKHLHTQLNLKSQLLVERMFFGAVAFALKSIQLLISSLNDFNCQRSSQHPLNNQTKLHKDNRAKT